MSLSSLLYSPLKEEDAQLSGWSKSTIEYILNNKTKVENSIRGIAKLHNKLLQRIDIDDIYMEIIKYLYGCDDYNISKAYERSNNVGVVVSLEGYVHSCIKFCVIRYITKNFSDESAVIHDTFTGEDDKELSLFDTIADNSSETSFIEMHYDLKTICKAYESQRYAFGPDIFQIWFVRLQTMVYEKQDKYREILTVLGISKKEISQIEKEALKDGAMLSIAKAITLIGIEKAVEVLRDYTYSADKIETVIKLF